jgi:Na+/H+ antiporter NhaC
MAKIWQVFAIVAAIAAAVFFYIRHERNSAKNEVKIENLEQENKGQNEIIKTNNIQKKLVSNTLVNNDVVARSEWLQLYFEEQAAD